MYQVVYLSRASIMLSPSEWGALLRTSRIRNRAAGLTGLLLSDGRRFIQALEGTKASVEQAMARIVRDPRHRDLVYMSRCSVPVPQFGKWWMESRSLLDARDAISFAEDVIAITVGVSDPNVRAAFVGFAGIARMAFAVGQDMPPLPAGASRQVEPAHACVVEG